MPARQAARAPATAATGDSICAPRSPVRCTALGTFRADAARSLSKENGSDVGVARWRGASWTCLRSPRLVAPIRANASGRPLIYCSTGDLDESYTPRYARRIHCRATRLAPPCEGRDERLAVRDRPRARHRRHRVRRRERRAAPARARRSGARVRAARLGRARTWRDSRSSSSRATCGTPTRCGARCAAAAACSTSRRTTGCWARDPRELYATNVLGTVHVMEACLAEGVERVVHTSTVGTVGLSDAPRPVRRGNAARARAAHEPLQAVEGRGRARSRSPTSRAGSRVVVVNPSAPVGAWDVKPTPTGRDPPRLRAREAPRVRGHRAQRHPRARRRGGPPARGGARPRRRALHPRPPEHDARRDPRRGRRGARPRAAPRAAPLLRRARGRSARHRGVSPRHPPAAGGRARRRAHGTAPHVLRSRGRRCASSGSRRPRCAARSRTRSRWFDERGYLDRARQGRAS